MIMRTSKKLLSFFLAVVMVITTCSVGFTAFAKDYNNIWNDSSEAADAFEALNGLADDYLPSALMGIDSIANGVYDKYAKDYGKTADELTETEKSEIAGKATLTDILTVLQPTLIDALAGVSQSEHAASFGDAHTASYYDYLHRDGTVDFYTLYALCRDYRNNRSLSSETRSTLTEWYNQLNQIANLDVVDSVQDAIDELIADFEGKVADPMNPGSYMTLSSAPLYMLEEYYADALTGLDEEIQAGILGRFEEATEDFKNYGAADDFKIDTFGKYAYYVRGIGQQLKYSYAYHSLVAAAGEKVNFTITPGMEDPYGFGLGVSETTTITEDITVENCTELYFEACGVSLDDLVNSFAGGNADLAKYVRAVFAETAAISVYNNSVIPDNYAGVIKGLAVKYSGKGVTGAAIDQMIQDKMPENYDTADVLDIMSEKDIKNIGSMIRTFTDSDVAGFFGADAVQDTDRYGGEINWALPSAFNGTYLGDFFELVFEESLKAQSTSDAIVTYVTNIKTSFYSQYTGSNYPNFLDLDGNPIFDNAVVTDPDSAMRDDESNLLCLNYTGATYDTDAIRTYIDDAERYAYSQVIADLFDIDVPMTRADGTRLNTDIDYTALLDACVPQPDEVIPVLTEEQAAILNADYDLSGTAGTELVNLVLNNTVSGIISNETVANIVNGLVTSDINLESAINNIWERLCTDPVSTIFELVPILVVLVDEMILPLVFNSGVTAEGGTAGVDYDMEAGLLEYAAFDLEIVSLLTSLLGMDSIYLKDYSYDYNTYVGIDQLGWDLNELLPDLMHWLLASKEEQKAKKVPGIEYYVDSNTTLPVYYVYEDYENQTTAKEILVYTGTEVVNADFDHYTVQDENGKVITRSEAGKDEDGNTVYNYTYNDVTGDIATVIGTSDAEFNCYMTYEAKVPYITGIYIADKALADARVDDMGKVLSGVIDDETVANGLGEIIAELATLFSAAVDEYVNSDRVNQIRYKNGSRLFAGLNNIFVALPQLIDIMEDLAADKYGTDKTAWTFCYDGKISATSEGNLAGPSAEQPSTINAPLEKFKSYAGSNDSDRAVDILDAFVDLVIEDWLNAVVSLVNNVITTDNVITQNLPIITGLLQALDGFGENSVFTDIFNGIFQLKRGDDASFEFKVQDNGFTGLSSENAYFLFANIDTLVTVILDLVDSFNGSNEADTASLSTSAASLLSSFSQENATVAAPSGASASGFSEDELKSVDTLITKLDETIASLLSNSSINDYTANNTENVISGVVSLLSNYISNDDAQDVVSLLDDYLYYLSGAGTRTPDENGNVKAEEVYTNKTLTDLVVRTFALIETIVQDLLADYDYVTGTGENEQRYNLLASAINGIISPDSIGIRLDDYADAQKDIMDLKSWSGAINADDTVSVNIDWNITDGDKDAFFNGVAASLRLVTSILGVILIDAEVYENALQPILATIGSYVGFTVDSAEEFADASNPYRDEVLLGILRPVVDFLDKFLEKPVTTLIKTVQALATILDDSNTQAGSIATIVSNTITPIKDELLGLAAILNVTSDKLNAASPTFAKVIEDLVAEEIEPLTQVENNQLVNLKIKDLPLCGENLIPIINTLLESFGISLNAIDWKALSQAATPADALAYFLEYVIETVTESENLDTIVSLIAGDSGVSDTINSLITAIKENKINAKGIVNILVQILNATQNPTIFAWSFEKYLQEAIEGFSYPLGLTKAQADEAATDIDAVINNLFPLLASLGVDLKGNNLSDILKNNLFKNELLTKLVVTLYEALGSNETVAQVLGILGIPSSTTEVAALLTDASYGATYSAAAEAIASKASWSEFYTVNANGDKENYANINWGFTDGAANAQQGFVNALVAILRPLNDVLAIFLNTGELTIGDALYELILAQNKDATTSGDLTYELKNGVLTLTVVDADNSGSQPSVIKIDLNSLDLLKDLSIKGTNGYNSAIIPLLEAFQCEGIVSEAQYKADYAAAKDNLLLDILNPIAGAASNSLLSKIVASPIVTIATILPTAATYLDASGLSQMVVNLLGPITNVIYAASEAVDIDAIISALIGGQSLGDYVAAQLGMAAGSVTINFSDLSTLNVEDMIIPLVNMLLKDYNLTFTNINWNTLISLGERTTYTSVATDENGNPLTGKTVTNVDYGKVLITFLRYVLNNLIANADAISALIMNIETDENTHAKVKDNATIVAILNNVFTQIKTHTADEIIVALYYFFVGNNTSDYWDYSNYKTKANSFKYPEGVTSKNVAKLISFLDGIIEEIDLNSILNQYLYTDSIINQLAKALYVDLNNVKISDSIMLGDILSIAGITVDKSSITSMLTDSKYGETAQFKAAADAIAAAADWASVDFNSLSWGVKDQDTFLHALVAVLRPFEGVLDVLLADGKLNLLGGIDIPGSNGYVNSIVPLLEAFRCEDIKSYEDYLADKNKAYDNLLIDVLEPLLGFINDVVANPLDTIASVLPNVALFIGNEGITQLVVNLITPVTELVKDINPVIDVDKLLQALIPQVANISIVNLDKFLEPYIGSENIVGLINSLLESTGIKLTNIDWLALASLGTVKNEASAVQCIGQRIVVDGNTSQVLIAVLRYVLDNVLGNKDAITKLLGDSYTGNVKKILDMIFKLKTDDILKLLFSIVDITQSPTEVYWSYEKYKAKYIKFKYPAGITAEDAENAVAQLDNAVSGVFALLQGLDVIDSADLKGVLNDALFTNEMLTRLAVDLYSALDTDKVSPYLEMFGIDVSPKDVAKLLTDKSYGKTYSAAAKTIKSKSSWSKLKTVTKNTTTYAKINWGFTNGASNAQQGFINGMTAIFRPFLDILGPFLNGTDLALGEMLYGVIVGLDVSTGDKAKGETLVTLKNGKLTIKTQSNGVYSTALTLDLANLKSLKELNLYGSNGYENSIIPLLDVLQVDNSEIKSFDQYVKDCKKAKDNILLDILNPLMSFINKVCEAPFDTITSVLPNLAYFIDNNGIGQLLDNLLSPVTQILKDAKKDGLDIDRIIKLAAGKDLGTLLLDLMKVDGVKFDLKLTDLSSCNIQEIVVPLLNQLLKSTGIKLPDFEWSTIAAHGDVVTSKSKAENSKGKFTNKEVIADKGETLVAVLRYAADLLITNGKSLKTLLGSIDAIKSNDMIKSIINSVFNTISTADDDAIVLAVFYFLIGEPTNAFWDYTAYETGEYDFSYPANIDVDFLKNLPPMLDGLISGLVSGGLNSLIGDALFKDEIISKLAIGLYGAIESVNINDDTDLAELLAMTGIDFTTANVAKLLVDEDYGQKFESASSVIASAGSWANVSEASLQWGVTDRDSFFHALVAVLRPIYGVLDVLLNDAYLGLFDIVRIPGSNGYTSSIVPLMEAFSMYNIKTQYQYREDIKEEYDNILLDIINPLWDKIEDLLNAPLQTLAAMVPNLALFIGNDGLCQIIDNLLTPVSALVDAIKPVVDLNDLLSTIFDALNVDLNALLASIGITNFSLDLYDLNATLKPLLSGDAIIPLLNSILGIIKIGGQPLGLVLNDVDWLQLASHGETKVSASQAATYGSRIYVEGDSSETLIAVLRYLIDTVNTGDNFDKINTLIGGLLGDGVDESVSDIISTVLGELQGDTDEVIAALVELLQTLA